MDMIEIPLHLIDEDTDQPRYRFDDEALQELMNSIGELGLLSPIKVRTTDGGRYKIIYGNRRYKACRMLGKAAIPCIVSNLTDETDIYLEQIAENLTREGFSPIEEGEAFHKLLNDPKFNSSVKFLASKLGKPESYIKNKCELLKFGKAVKKLVVGGTEIRKDRLTEEQLLPLKDLPLEHRDPLALIVARDELPVSDVKKIAKLFKDKGISAGTKDKLLYKTGFELLQTWSVFEQNKAERTKPSEPKPAKKGKGEAEAGHEPSGGDAAGQAQADAGTAAVPAGMHGASGPQDGAAAHDPQGGAAAFGLAGAEAAGPDAAGPDAAAAGERPPAVPQDAGAARGAGLAGASAPDAAAVLGKLEQLQAALTAHAAGPADADRLAQAMEGTEQAAVLERLEQLIGTLERQLGEWKALRQAAASGPAASGKRGG